MTSSAHILASFGLSPSILEANHIRLQELHLPANTQIFSPGDSCENFFILVSGRIDVELTARSGREVVLYSMQAGETCVATTSALLQDQDYFARGLAHNDVHAISLTKADFQRALKVSAQFTQLILRDYAQRVCALMSLVNRITSRDLMGNIIEVLLSQTNEYGKVEMTQSTLAKEIGSSREAVARKLSELENQHLIERQRGVIVLLDNKALQNIAD